MNNENKRDTFAEILELQKEFDQPYSMVDQPRESIFVLAYKTLKSWLPS